LKEARQREEERQQRKLDPAELSFFERLQSHVAVRSTDSSLVPGNVVKMEKICGVDAIYGASSSTNDDDDDDRRVTAVAATLDSRSMAVVETFTHHGSSTFPYASGLFFLREGPPAVAAVEGLGSKPDLVCFDGHGIAHPRGLGLATVCGLILDLPSIGLAKSRLVGELEPYKHGIDRIIYREKTVGLVTRYRGARKYWSPGYMVSLERLEWIVENYSEVCVRSIAEADQVARSDAHAPPPPPPPSSSPSSSPAPRRTKKGLFLLLRHWFEEGEGPTSYARRNRKASS
jgi:deoxyinosine 3'endonuclease (endonuclease V)